MADFCALHAHFCICPIKNFSCPPLPPFAPLCPPPKCWCWRHHWFWQHPVSASLDRWCLLLTFRKIFCTFFVHIFNLILHTFYSYTQQTNIDRSGVIYRTQARRCRYSDYAGQVLLTHGNQHSWGEYSTNKLDLWKWIGFIISTVSVTMEDALHTLFCHQP